MSLLNLKTFFYKPKPVQIVGTFRSGTNLFRYSINTALQIPTEFSRYWWKHLPAPTVYSSSRPTSTFSPDGFKLPDSAFVVVTKDPLIWLTSIHDFWIRRRPGLSPAENFEDFIGSRFLVHDSSFGGAGPRYLYSTPIDYWVQFYFSYCSWPAMKDRIIFCKLEDLLADPGNQMRRIGDFLNAPVLRQITQDSFRNTILPGRDGKSTNFKNEEYVPKATKMGSRISTFIKSRIPNELLSDLGYTGL